VPSIRVVYDGKHEELGAELGLGRIPVVHTKANWTIDAMEHGMQSGETSLMVLIPAVIEGLKVYVAAETSLQAYVMAASILATAHPDEIEKPGFATLSPAARQVLSPRIAEAVRRAVPTATPEQAAEAAEMIMDGYAADDPRVPQDGQCRGVPPSSE
jgi:hypothetical protein